MNREIKFRGQDIETKEWHYGGLFQIGEEFYIIDGSGSYNLRAVIPETVTQYINLKDIDGIKEIYEGDFVTRDGWDDEALEIIYDEEDFAFKTREHIQGKQYLWSSSKSELINYKCYTIIGNRFDNPELVARR